MFDVEPLSFVRGGMPHHLLVAAREGQLWRPTAVALLRCGDKYCVTKHITNGCKPNGKSRKRKVKSDLPKGGIDPGETVEYALLREIQEEVRLSRQLIVSKRYLGYTLVPFSKYNQGRDGYELGKIYLIYEIVVSRPVVSPGRNHRVISVTWRSDFWNHFRPKSKKRTIFSQSNLLSLLIRMRR